MSTASGPFETDMYSEPLPLVTAERFGSYLRASGGDVSDAFALYEWNMHAAASIIELTSMVEVSAARRCIMARRRAPRSARISGHPEGPRPSDSTRSTA